jgi:seryl-tRNA synthetase
MLDINLLRETPEIVRSALERRGATSSLPILDEVLRSDEHWRLIVHDLEMLRAARNRLTEEVKRLKKLGQPADAMIAESRENGEKIKAREGQVVEEQARRDELLLKIPNVPLPEVPAGPEENNVVVKTWGEPRDSAGVKPHWEIAEALGVLDLARGAKIAGSGFIVFRGMGARLVRGLMQWMLTLHTTEHGYEEVWIPVLVNGAAMTGTGQLPKFAEDMYTVPDDKLYLIPTSEVPVTNLYREEIIDQSLLPLALTAYSPCFRREAGSYGKDTRGLLRVHQFDKVELVRMCAPEDSPAQHELLTRQAEHVLEALGLPHRRVLLAAGDTGFASAKTYDLEVWAPGVGKWLEVSSCSTFTDFQARRANIRFRRDGGKPQFVHTLNGSGVAFPRTIAAIFEHYQQPDGTVIVPEVLRPYVGAARIGLA